jgi:hypothetical protein
LQDKRRGVVNLSGFLKQRWKDPRLAYAHKYQYTGLDIILLRPEDVWLPDFTLYNP